MSKLKEYNGHFCESEYEYAFIAFLEKEGWQYLQGSKINDGGIGVRRIFKFHYTDRQPIDKQKHIRPAGLLLAVIDILYGKLINTTENILLGIFKVD